MSLICWFFGKLQEGVKMFCGRFGLVGKLGKGWMSGEMVEGQSSFAINHGNRQKAEWALAFSQEGQAQSNSLSRQTVISNIETMGPRRFFCGANPLGLGLGGEKPGGFGN